MTINHPTFAADLDSLSTLLEAGGLRRAIRPHVACDQLAIGVLGGRQQRPDEILLGDGIYKPELTKWCSAATSDPLLRAAKRTGSAVASTKSKASTLTKSGHAAARFHSDPISHTAWWLIAARRRKSFDEADQQRLGILLERWRSGFMVPAERGLATFLLGHDDRLILASLDAQEHILARPSIVNELVVKIREIGGQRFPNLADEQRRDLAVELDGQRLWVRLRYRRAAAGEDARQLLLELRPLEETDMPPVGVVEHQQIADAIEYIHAHYADAPSLAEIAGHVKLSAFHFHRMFAREVGVTPKQYLMNLRLQMAKWTLRATRTPIGEIGVGLGFSSHGHFTATFSRLIGTTPTEYRERHG